MPQELLDIEVQKLKRRELEEILQNAFLDREKAEIVARTESCLLDVEVGEVLENSRYVRMFTL